MKKQINSTYVFCASNRDCSVVKKFIVMIERKGCDRNGCPVYVASVIEDLRKDYYACTSAWCYRIKSYEGEYSVAKDAAERCFNEKTNDLCKVCC